MNLIESYSLQAGAKIDKPFILQKFFPLAVQKYIVLQPFSKPSKSYDLWNDVTDILKPILSQNGIEIVQIGAKGEPSIKNCYGTVGQTNLGQAAYIINGCELFLGSDSFGAHIAGSLGKKIVALYSNNYVECVKPYWANEADRVLLTPPSQVNNKPSFSMQEMPKTVNEIPPEVVASSVLKLLDIEHKNEFETIYVGQNYNNRFVETLPNQILNPNQFGIDSFVVRMDFLFDENVLAQQLNICKCTIVTNRPINKDLLKTFKANIKEVIFNVEGPGSVNFLNELAELNINCFILSSAKGDILNDIKLEFLDHGNINSKSDNKKEIDSIRQKSNGAQLYYKSVKYTLSEGKIYPSRAALLANASVDSFDYPPQPIIENEDFWKELEHFRIIIDKAEITR